MAEAASGPRAVWYCYDVESALIQPYLHMVVRNDTLLPRVLYFVSPTGAKCVSTRIIEAKKNPRLEECNVCHFEI